jgi:cytochrome c biogenesis protein CcdA/DsbC/DsbD-like thiol-disulfide interchange protein
MNGIRTLFVFFGLLVASAPAGAQQHASGALYTRAEDDFVRAAIEIRIDRGWHLYHEELGHPDAIGKPLSVKLTGAGIEWSEVRFPEPDKTDQPAFDAWIYSHHGKIVLHAIGRVAAGASADDAGVELDGLTCEEEGLCVPYRESLTTDGEGPSKLFASFPADLAAPAAQAAPVEQTEPVEQADPVPAADIHRGGHADATLTATVDGDRVTATISIAIEDTWHLYHAELGDPNAIAKPTRITMHGAGVTWDAPSWPEPHKYDQPGLDSWVYGHEGTIEVTVTGTLASGASVDGIWAELDGQTCDPNFCVNYKETIVLGGGDPGAVVPDDVGTAVGEVGEVGTVLRKFEGAAFDRGLFRDFLAGEGEFAGGLDGEDEDEGLGLFLLAAVGWGLFTLLMPCTYPMIPITISFFTKQADARGGKVLPLSLLYGAGIVAIFVLIGVVLGAPIIKFATHPLTNAVIGVLFVYFALVLFGLITMEPPRAVMNMAGKAQATGGYLGVFLMGATLVVTSFTCTAPFVGSLLGLGAKHGLAKIALGMGVFGLTMAIPFVLLSLVPGRIQAMPKSGMWMNTLKFTLGFVELAAALKFFSNSDLVWFRDGADPGTGLLSREVFLILWLVIFAIAGLYLLGALRFKDPEGTEIGGVRRLSGAAFLALAAYCGWGTLGKPIDPVMIAIVPPYSGGAIPLDFSGGDVESWELVKDDFDEAFALARAQDKLLFVNLTGHT